MSESMVGDDMNEGISLACIRKLYETLRFHYFRIIGKPRFLSPFLFDSLTHYTINKNPAWRGTLVYRMVGDEGVEPPTFSV